MPPQSITRSLRAAIQHAISLSCRTRGGLIMTLPPHPLKVVTRFGSRGRLASMPTVKARQNRADFERAWPRNWEKVRLLKLFSHWKGLSVGATRTGDCRCRRCRPMREMALNRSAGRQSEQYGQTRDAGVQVGT